MAHAKDFKDAINNLVERDPAFREELLKEGVKYRCGRSLG